MGLETVEVVMALEEEYMIELPDESLYQVRTVGELHQLLMDRLKLCYEHECTSRHYFYKIRKYLNELNGVRERIKPSSLLEDFFPLEERRAKWWSLQNNFRGTGLIIRDLECSRFLKIMSACGVWMIIGYWLWLFLNVEECAYMALFLAFYLIFSIVLKRKLSFCFPGSITTVGELTKSAIGGKERTVTADYESRAVFSTLKDILVEQLGVNEQYIVPEARLIEDLGMD